MARCKHYIEAFDCCAKASEFIEDVLWVKSCYYKDDVCPDCRYFEEKEYVVPVVRCKNCIHYQNEWCEILKAESPVEDGFCCYGERKDSND